MAYAVKFLAFIHDLIAVGGAADNSVDSEKGALQRVTPPLIS